MVPQWRLGQHGPNPRSIPRNPGRHRAKGGDVCRLILHASLLGPWNSGPKRSFHRSRLKRARLFLSLIILALVGWLGWLYGSRFLAIRRLEAEVISLRAEEKEKLREIGELEEALARTDDPQVVEEWARRLLHFGFPGEERVIIIRR